MKKNLNIDCIKRSSVSISMPQIGDSIKVKLPSRIHMSLLNDTRISLGSPGGGGLVMAIDGFQTDVTMKVIGGNTTSVLSGNANLVDHIINLFCSACSIKRIVGIEILVSKNENIHLGFGSSVIEFFGILLSLNVLYGDPLTNEELRKLVGYNYMEWDNSKNKLCPGYETGGGPASALYGGLLLLTDKLEIVEHMNICSDYKIFCFIPNKKYIGDRNISRSPDGENVVFLQSSKFQSIINGTSDKVLYDLIPAIKRENIVDIGDIIEDLNFMMGTIGTIKTRYSVGYYYLFEKIRSLGAQISGISSTGPTVYVLATNDIILKIQNEMSADIEEGLGIFDVSKGLEIYYNGSKINREKYPNTSHF